LSVFGLLLKCALHSVLTLCFCVRSLIGKKVFNVPKESLDGVENVIAICDAGQLDNKVLSVEFLWAFKLLIRLLNSILDFHGVLN
jgi:hypothetical protein